MPISTIGKPATSGLISPHYAGSAYATQGQVKQSTPKVADQYTATTIPNVTQTEQRQGDPNATQTNETLAGLATQKQGDTATSSTPTDASPFAGIASQLATATPASTSTPSPFADIASQIAQPTAAVPTAVNQDTSVTTPTLPAASPVESTQLALASGSQPGFTDIASQIAANTVANQQVTNPTQQTTATPVESTTSALSEVPFTAVDPSLTQIPLTTNTAGAVAPTTGESSGNQWTGTTVTPSETIDPDFNGAATGTDQTGTAAYQAIVDAGATGLAPSAELGTVADVSGANPYSDKVSSQFGEIANTIADQKAHAQSLIEQEKQKSINDLSGVLGRMGTGTSYATMLSGLGGIESASTAEQAAQNVALDKQQVEQQLAVANAMISAGDVEGGQKLKAEIANQATDLQENAQSMDASDQQFEQTQAVQNQIMTNIQNIQTAMGDTTMSDTDRKEFNSALQSMSDAQASGDYNPNELLQLYFSLFAKWSDLAGVGYTPDSTSTSADGTSK